MAGSPGHLSRYRLMTLKDNEGLANDVLGIIREAAQSERWPELDALLRRPLSGSSHMDVLVGAGCAATGGNPELQPTAIAACLAMQMSIVLVDDLLDEDDKGHHHKVGIGPAANMALALQSAAFECVAALPIHESRKYTMSRLLHRMNAATAYGQHLDQIPVETEEDYWRVVTHKSEPFFGIALSIGAHLGEASQEIMDRLTDLGRLWGTMVQIQDDLDDALTIPARPDWRGRNNLPILYGHLADYPEKERFLHLCKHLDEEEVLEEAQNLLYASGAVSYCVYHLMERHKQVKALLGQLQLAESGPLKAFFDERADALIQLLRDTGSPLNEEDAKALLFRADV